MLLSSLYHCDCIALSADRLLMNAYSYYFIRYSAQSERQRVYHRHVFIRKYFILLYFLCLKCSVKHVLITKFKRAGNNFLF